MKTVHVPLPDGSHYRIPFLGTILTKAAMDSIALHRTDLFKDGSDYRVMRVIPDKLWLARLKVAKSPD